MKIKKLIWLLVFVPVLSLASEGGIELYHADIDLSDKRSLQRGARLFVNYCLSCHSASFMRYNRMAEDLGVTPDQLRDNLMFTTDKVGDTMTVAMTQEDGTRWFGSPPPDLSVIARARGVDWLYTYLLTFYKDDDPSRPWGVNNLAFPDVGMPHVLWQLQGLQVPVYRETAGHNGEMGREIDRLEPVTEGSMNPAEFRRAMRDLVNFLAYLSEPAKLQRYRIGAWVLLFLVLFFVVAYALKKDYWKDVR